MGVAHVAQQHFEGQGLADRRRDEPGLAGLGLQGRQAGAEHALLVVVEMAVRHGGRNGGADEQFGLVLVEVAQRGRRRPEKLLAVAQVAVGELDRQHIERSLRQPEVVARPRRGQARSVPAGRDAAPPR